MSDQIGRRSIFTSGFLIVCLALVIMPLATSPAELMLFRVVMAVGIACCTTMIAALAADYPQNASRGKLYGISGICTALGIVIVDSGMTQLPRVFDAYGYTPVEAGTYTLWLGGLLALVAAVITISGTRKGRIADQTARLSFLQHARIGMRDINSSPRLRIGVVATALSRGDLTVLATFFALWIQKSGSDQGITAVDASATGGMLFGMIQLAMLVFLPAIAVLADRLDRMTTLCWSMAFAALGYIALALVPDPFNSGWMYVAIVLAGLGEAVVLISVPVLIGEEAPVATRGSIIGVSAGFGALGIIATNKAAGYLFDDVGYQAPFIFMALLNAALFLWAAGLRARELRA